MKHLQVKCRSAGTDHGGRICPLCDGGLIWCELCGGAEASLTTDCPGRQMSPDELDAVQAGTLDFRNGEWEKRNG